MKIDILTLFPEMFDGFINSSIIKRAIDKEKVVIDVHNIRNYSTSKNKQVDDYPYGGGAGMVLMCDPIFRAIDDLREDDSVVVMMAPGGKLFKESDARVFSKIRHLILLCGHYEGFDERIKTIVDMEVSLGDFVLTGGEIPAMAIVDATVRLLDGVISKDSLDVESFDGDLLDYPVYTKPYEYRGLKVPDVLLSGHHENIKKFRDNERIRLTNLRKDKYE